MSEQALIEFEAARMELLKKQRVCSWCDKTCESSDHLVIHILLRHPKTED